MSKAREDPLIRAINKKILRRYLAIDNTGNFTNPPSNDEELYEFVCLAFKVKIPRKVVEPGHSTPFQFLADCFFEREKNALAFASRNGSKTFTVAILNVLDMVFKPGCEIASAGAVKTQAKKAYTYFLDFLEMDWFKEFAANYEKKTGKRLLQKEIQEETTFATKSKQQILTATEKGLRSPHPHKARIDEVDEIPWSILQTGLSMARTGENIYGQKIRGQNIFTSTRQNAHGSMQALLDRAGKNGAIKVYEWNIWEVVKKCERRCFNDPEHGHCPIYAYCQGKAHRCDGFYEIEDFIDKVRLIDREKFETEWENKKPTRNKLVYAEFEPTKHILTPEKLKKLTGYDRIPGIWYRTAGIDFGASPGHPFVYLKLAQIPTTGAWVLFHEYVAEQRLIRDHATAIKSSPHWSPNDEIYADTAGKQERMELKSRGIRTKDAVKDVHAGIDYVRTQLAGFPPTFEPMLYVWHECTFTINEFNSYAWPSRPDGKPDKSGNPQKEDDHCLAPDTKVNILGKGWVEIQTLRGVSGEILTPLGYLPFERARRTQENADTYRVVFEDGSSHVATGEHLFLMDTFRYASVDELQSGDSLLEVSYGSRGPDQEEATVQREELLPVWEILQPPLEGRGKGIPSPCGLGVGERSNPRRNAHSPQGPRQDEQLAVQPVHGLTEGALRRAHDRATQGGVAGELIDQRSSQSHGVALLSRRPAVAPRPRQGTLGEANFSDVFLSTVRTGISVEEEGRSEVLFPEVQTAKFEEPTQESGGDFGSRVPSMRHYLQNLAQREDNQEVLFQELCGERAVGSKKVKEVVYVGKQDVWCLNVPGIHCFLLDSGVISHNCMDAIRYSLYSRTKRRVRTYRTRKANI